MAVKDLAPKKAAAGRVYYQLDYDVIILFGLTELEAQLSWKTKVSCVSIPLAFLLTSHSFQHGERR